MDEIVDSLVEKAMDIVDEEERAAEACFQKGHLSPVHVEERLSMELDTSTSESFLSSDDSSSYNAGADDPEKPKVWFVID